jgi:hypothetical protein
MPVTAHGIFGREPDRGKVMSAGGNVALAREFTLGKIPVGLSASLPANLNSTGDLGFVMPNYTFATPVLGGQLTVGVPIKRSVATVAGDRVGCFQSQVVGISPGRLQPAKRFGKAR